MASDGGWTIDQGICLRYIDVAIELWQLADDEKCAAQLEKVIDQGYARESLVLETDEVSDALRLLDGLARHGA